MPILETIEWCDFWWSSTDDDSTSRVMLIGDSITRSYRPVVAKTLKNICNIDMLATSKALDNPAFRIELDYALSLKKYKVIHFNNGLHGFHISKEEYYKHLEDIILYIKERSYEAKLIIATTTPVTQKENPQELNTESNVKVIDRNDVVLELATKHGLEIDDLYSNMLGKSELSLGDGFHYNEKGIDLQGMIVSEKLKDLIIKA